MKTSNNKQNDLFYSKCKEGNLKVTVQRTIIYEELIDDKSHPSADEIFQKVRKKIPSISFDTVNRTLLSFVEIGLLKMIRGYGRPKRFDPCLEKHHHFQCTKCKKIIDFYDETLDNIEIPENIKNKFNIIGKKILLEGHCKKCVKDK